MAFTQPHVLGLLLLVGIVFFSWDLPADEVRCPVCEQAFSKDTDICPNDGTDLRLRGIHIKTERDEAGKEPNPAQSDASSDTGQKTSGASKYKRRDVESRRTQQKKPPNSGYSDRRSRIDVERGSAEAEQQKRQREKQAFEAEDNRRMEAFESRRVQLWEAKQNQLHEENKAREEKEKALEKLLNSMSAPRISLGFRMFWMGEGNDLGPVSAVEIEANLTKYLFRAGLSTLFGARSVQDRNDFVFLAHLSAGFQWPHRFSPFLVVRAGLGALTSERFGTHLSYLLTSVGFDAGLDSWITPWIAISVTAGYERCMMENAHWDSFTYKISIGF
ncbi:MAG: hypothetical protein GY762_21125 [Proteobacteria bacterium]|nr:hypothetical protein [Pseudomonadota bacterium]